MELLQGIINTLLNLIYPPRCIFCGELLEFDTKLEVCEECLCKVTILNSKFDVLEDVGSADKYCEYVIGVFQYSGAVKDSLIRYKFHNKPSYFRTFAAFACDSLLKFNAPGDFDMILSVPLYREKQFLRGYNQAYLISKSLSKMTGIEEASRLLKRVRNTRTQSLLPKEERNENVKGAFRVVREGAVKNKSILLIDDILTTGNTLNECARVLKEAGARSVAGCVIATGRQLDLQQEKLKSV